jgi:hypothetical protein
LESYKTQLDNNKAEIARMDKILEEIPVNRVTKRLQVRAGQEPLIADLNKKTLDLESQITTSNLAIIEVKKKVGPLIYISRAFDMDIDSVVKYLILVLVLVFDPLAICLVIATTEALNQRRLQALYADAIGANAPTAATASTPPPAQQSPLTTAPSDPPASAPAIASVPDHPASDDPAVEEVLQMRFADDKDKNAV